MKKRCTKCGVMKDLNDYYTDNQKSDGKMYVCKKCHKVMVNEYASTHPEKAKARSRKYYLNNIQACFQKMKKWNSENKEKVEACTNKWRRNNPEKSRQYNSSRRAKIKNSTGKITPEEWKGICDKYNNKCLCCGRSDVKITLDHIIPLELGGSNTADNAQPLCKPCNSRKHIKIIDYRKGW